MTIPKSYEALAADLASEKILSKTLQGQKESYMILADGRKFDLDAIQRRLTVAEQLLREITHSGEWNSSALEFTGCNGFDVLEKIEAALNPAAEQRATEMEMDKRRLDFLQENLVSINCRIRNTGFCGPRGREFAAYIYAAGPNDKKPGEGETLRQAIDSMVENNGVALKPSAKVEGS